ncbi:hypothetical protein V2J09_001848 [Rumex salicifolius]
MSYYSHRQAKIPNPKTTMNFEPFNFILERLSNYMENEFIALSMDTKSAVDSLRKELEMMESYFMDVDKVEQRVTTSHVLQTQLQHLREIAPQIEDLLDTLCQEAEDRSQGSILKKLKAFVSSSNPLMHTRRLIDKVRELKDILRETVDRPKGYQLPSYLPRITHKRRILTRPQIVDDGVIVGLEEDVNTLVAKFSQGEGKTFMSTLAIVGMGGSGKTTLAKMLYNHKGIVEQFSSRAWVCVSSEWDTPSLLQNICVQIGIQLPKVETPIYLHKLEEFLVRNSCLIVLDDVWKMEALQDLYPTQLSSRTSERSLVLITTRNEELMKFLVLDDVHIHKARCLTKEESWDLFSATIRKNWQGKCSFEGEGDFARLGKEMLEKCNGLPLAIVALGGILSAKDTIQEWEGTKNDMSSRIMRYNQGFYDYGPVKEMLELSYFDLPYHLKPCFLYLGIFREDDQISAKELIWLWIAEGFIKSDQCLESETLEDVAWLFLDELIQRCLVQVVDRDAEGAEVEVLTIRMHDLLRDLCIEKAKNLNFFCVSSQFTLVPPSMEPLSQRAIIYQRYISILISINHGGVALNIGLSYANIKLLRVLVLQKVVLRDSAEQIGSLVLLRYLRIQWCIGPIPNSIQELRNLLTFIYSGDGAELRNNMLCNMEHLRHLCLTCGAITRPNLGANKSTNLQVLDSPAGPWMANEGRSVWIGLREMKLRNIHSQAQLEGVYDFVSNPSNHLHILCIYLKEGSMLEFDLAKLKLKHCRLLKRLVLRGKVRQQQKSCLSFSTNLLSMSLAFTQIENEEDLKGALAQLGQLRFLNLTEESYKGKRLTFKGLPQLQDLRLTRLLNLKECRIEDGALTQLKRLQIMECYQLERIPMGISCLRSLQCFEANYMLKSFCDRIRGPSNKEKDNGNSCEGEDFHLIQHIPSIKVFEAQQVY